MDSVVHGPRGSEAITEGNVRVPRDTKWLIPAMSLGDGRCLRSKRKSDTPISKELTKSRLKYQKPGTKSPTRQARQPKDAKYRGAVDSRKSETTTQTKTQRHAHFGKRLSQRGLKTKSNTNRNKKENHDFPVKETSAVNSDMIQVIDSACDTGRLKTKAEYNGNRIQCLPGKYTCNLCGEYFIKESKLAEHIKWFHGVDVEKNGAVKVNLSPKINREKEAEITTDSAKDPECISDKNDIGKAEVEELRKSDISGKTDQSSTQENSDSDQTASGGGNEIKIVTSASVVTTDLYETFVPESVCVVTAAGTRKASFCPFCSKSLASRKGMKAHVELYCKGVPFRCAVCGKGLLSLDQDHKHVTPGSIKKKQYYIKQADQHKAYKCKHCSRGFAYLVTLENHLLVCRGEKQEAEDKGKVKCQYCNKVLSRAYMPSHMKYHENKRLHVCDFCGSGFNTYSRMMNHIEMIHKKATTFQCQHCGAIFSQKSALQNHQSVLFGKCKADKTSKAAFQCKLCTRTFTSLRWMTRHQETHLVKPDGGDVLVLKDFSCSFCGKRFKNKHEHIRHVRIHTNERPHKCHQCGVAFVQKSNLQAHMRVHTGERPYVCHLCLKSFTQQSNLKSHLLKHYNGKIPEDSIQKTGTKDSSMEKYRADKDFDSVVQNRTKKVDTACQTSLTSKRIIKEKRTNNNGSIIVTVTSKSKNITIKSFPNTDGVMSDDGLEFLALGPVGGPVDETIANNDGSVDTEHKTLKNILNMADYVNDNATANLTHSEGQVDNTNDTAVGDEHEYRTGDSDAINVPIANNTLSISEDQTIAERTIIYVSDADIKAGNVVIEPQETVENDVIEPQETVENVVIEPQETVETVVIEPQETVENVVTETQETVENVVIEPQETVENVVIEPQETVENVVTETQETVVYVFDEAGGEASQFLDNKERVVDIIDTVNTEKSKETGDIVNSFNRLCASIADIHTIVPTTDTTTVAACHVVLEDLTQHSHNSV